MGFEATGSTDTRLHYKFAPYDDAEGVTPEPTTDQIEEFFSEWRDISLERIEFAEELAPKDQEGKARDETAKELRERELAQRPRIREFNTRTRDRRNAALAALCSDQPNAEQIATLPGRVFIEFQNHIIGELTPED